MKKTALFTAALCLLQSSLHADVPVLINYQGKVADSTGLPIGATGTASAPVAAPVNRKVIFRVYDASTGGTRLWTEEQTATISLGVFSVLLGNGIAPTGTAVGESRPALDTVFTPSTTSRFLEIMVDNGDNTINASDVPISPRQQITSTAFALHAKVADGVASAVDLALTPVTGTATNYGLGWYGTGRTYNSIAVDGPVLYGNAGGALGSNASGTKNLALLWNAAGQVGVGATSSFDTNNKLTLQGDDASTPARQLVIRGNTTPTERVNIGFDTTLNQATVQSYTAAATVGNLQLNPSGGNIGIGSSTAPAAKLSIGAPISGDASTLSTSFATNAGALGTVVNSELLLGNFGFTTSNSDSLAISAYRTAAGTSWADTALVLGMNVDTTKRAGGFLSLHSTGNIGIGTLTPSYKLDVNGTARVANHLFVDGDIAMKSGYRMSNSDGALYLSTLTAQPTIFQTNNTTETMRITTAGKVGIGTNSPSNPLSVEGGGQVASASTSGAIAHVGTSGDVATYFGNYNGTNAYGTWLQAVRPFDQQTFPMALNPNGGNVGIGTGNPLVPLDVAGYKDLTMYDNGILGAATTLSGTNYTLTNATNSGGGIEVYSMSGIGNWAVNYSVTGRVGIRSQWAIATGSQFLAYSDRRIKRDFHPSPTADDLALIEKLQATDYHMIDPDAGTEWKKGFIAQEVEKVIPQAVTRSSEFVPEIMSLATASHFNAADKTLALTLSKDHALKVGDKVRLHLDGRRLDLVVGSVPSARELVMNGCDIEPRKVLVYGKQVNDFRTVDYDRIFTTGIGAIQELNRQLKEKDAKIAALEAKIAAQDTRATAQADEDASQNARLVALEKLLNKSGAPETVSTQLGGQ